VFSIHGVKLYIVVDSIHGVVKKRCRFAVQTVHAVDSWLYIVVDSWLCIVVDSRHNCRFTIKKLN
jgi:hypothetical protein